MPLPLNRRRATAYAPGIANNKVIITVRIETKNDVIIYDPKLKSENNSA